MPSRAASAGSSSCGEYQAFSSGAGAGGWAGATATRKRRAFTRGLHEGGPAAFYLRAGPRVTVVPCWSLHREQPDDFGAITLLVLHRNRQRSRGQFGDRFGEPQFPAVVGECLELLRQVRTWLCAFECEDGHHRETI